MTDSEGNRDQLIATVRLAVREELDSFRKELVTTEVLELVLAPLKAQVAILQDNNRWLWRTVTAAAIVAFVTPILTGNVTIGG
jgi:hypothetical protein